MTTTNLLCFAMFVADGPFVTLLKRRKRERSSLLLRALPTRMRRAVADRWLRDDHNERRGEAQIIEGFDNVEIYGLITKLLGIEKFASPTNGTAGFWDRYLDEDK